MFKSTNFVAVRFILLVLGLVLFANANPIPSSEAILTQEVEISSNLLVERAATSSYWINTIKRQGTVAYGSSTFQIYRNVMSYGAKGDGVTDDTAAINSAISAGNRCGQGCDSSTVTPALVYFPPGTYLVSAPIVQYYYTQLIGDAINPPTLKAASAFSGIAVIDSDPYLAGGAQWYTNQNNFFRQVRNFVIDLTALPMSTGTGIHWQVAQATSLQNIVINMVQGGGSSNKQQGIFMENGSANFLSDVTFNGGGIGFFAGNQQIETARLTFNGCQTAILMNWNWVWSLKSITINNCAVGVDMTSGGSSQSVGSLLLTDSIISNTPVGVKTAWSSSSTPTSAGTLIIDNVDFTKCTTAVQNNSGGTVLAGGTVVASWGQGRMYTGNAGSRSQGSLSAPNKVSGLLDSSGRFFTRARPQYANLPASSFVSVKNYGAKGDGVTDDTAAVQAAMNAVLTSQVLYFDHGAYVISSTVNVPKNIKITGEAWPLIMAKGNAFQNQNSPQPVWRVGQKGDVGTVEISDLIFETIGAQPGAIMMEWNVAGATQGSAAMWDTHFRIGGSAGTKLQSNTCAKNPSVTAAANPACIGAFLLLHVTSSAAMYLENSWMWVADHELDLSDHAQVNIFNGRGLLIESTQPTWLYGTSVEHSVLYNYNLNGAQNLYMNMIQTETPYFQSNPDATTPFSIQGAYNDPTFSWCAAGDESCKKALGLFINNSVNVLIYGAGLYSFFDNYGQTCLNTNSCQKDMVVIANSQVHMYAFSTVGATNMAIDQAGNVLAAQADNTDTFASTVAMWKSTW